MKTKLLSVVLLCFGYCSTANATMYNYTGNPIFMSVDCFAGTCPKDYTTSIDIFYDDVTGNASVGGIPVALSGGHFYFDSVTAWDLFISVPGPGGYRIVSNPSGDSLLFNDFEEGSSEFSISGSAPAGTWSVTSTPLPAALPLFATGLGAMGLFGWRRKPKNPAAIAAA